MYFIISDIVEINNNYSSNYDDSNKKAAITICDENEEWKNNGVICLEIYPDIDSSP